MTGNRNSISLLGSNIGRSNSREIISRFDSDGKVSLENFGKKSDQTETVTGSQRTKWLDFSRFCYLPLRFVYVYCVLVEIYFAALYLSLWGCISTIHGYSNTNKCVYPCIWG